MLRNTQSKHRQLDVEQAAFISHNLYQGAKHVTA
jgi:hypothetical protein